MRPHSHYGRIVCFYLNRRVWVVDENQFFERLLFQRVSVDHGLKVPNVEVRSRGNNYVRTVHVPILGLKINVLVLEWSSDRVAQHDSVLGLVAYLTSRCQTRRCSHRDCGRIGIVGLAYQRTVVAPSYNTKQPFHVFERRLFSFETIFNTINPGL